MKTLNAPSRAIAQQSVSEVSAFPARMDTEVDLARWETMRIRDRRWDGSCRIPEHDYCFGPTRPTHDGRPRGTRG
jgi:hypothetical protein